ncbi:hypothetical protein [Pseudomonas fluorescens]|nr:hypothetical protein [Pseudomonas fluorescens]
MPACSRSIFFEQTGDIVVIEGALLGETLTALARVTRYER